MKPRASRGGTSQRWVGVAIGAGVLATGALVGLILLDFARGAADVGAADPASARGRSGAPALRLPGGGGVAEADEVPATPPWEATEEGAIETPEGHVPAWEVRSPPPDTSIPPAPEPQPPADPATVRPPLHNPGGVNGSRPPRGGSAER